MKNRIVVAFVLFTFAGGAAAPARAQIRESAARLATATALEAQPASAARRRSAARTWTGIGLIAGGLALAFTGQDDCVATGSLDSPQSYTREWTTRNPAPFSDFLFHYEDHTFTAGNLRAIREHTNAPDYPGCRFIFDHEQSAVRNTYENPTATRTGGTTSFSWSGVIHHQMRSVVRSARTDHGGAYERMLGDADVVERRPRARLWTGIGLAAGGALLATLWADVPVARDIRVGVVPGRFTVGGSVGF